MEYLICPECAVKNLPGRSHCLGCGKSLEGVEAASISLQVEDTPAVTGIQCLRCQGDMLNAGVRSLHEYWSRFGILDELTELILGRTNLTMYVCVQCGHVEFFMEGMGDRAQKSP
jgi:DNA-directed RNA polymerase subunit RPC12/RpoP